MRSRVCGVGLLQTELLNFAEHCLYKFIIIIITLYYVIFYYNHKVTFKYVPNGGLWWQKAEDLLKHCLVVCGPA